jgi:hypothetical protein
LTTADPNHLPEAGRPRPTVPVDPDDQTWMGTCALLLLTGVAAGLIALASDFNDTRWLYNGWTHIVGLVLVMGSLLWIMSKLRGRMRQRMQAAVLVSLFLHITFGFYIHRTSVAVSDDNGEDDAREEQVADAPPVTLPDYTPTVAEDGVATSPEIFERPVDTLRPEAAREAIDRQMIDAPTSVASRPLPSAELTPTVDPARIELNRDESAASRRGTELADLRRQPLVGPDMQQESIPLPEVSQQPGAAPGTAEPTVSVNRQQASAPLGTSAPLPRAPSDDIGPEGIAMTRQQTEQRPSLPSGEMQSPPRQAAQLPGPELAPLEAPVVAQAVQPGVENAQPAPIELAKSGSGVPTATGVIGADGDLPVGLEMPRLSPAPSRRPGLSQAPSAAGLSPGPPSQIPRSIAGADLSRVAGQAEAVPAAGLAAAGGNRGSSPEASSSASGRASGPALPGPAIVPSGGGGSAGPSAPIASNLSRAGSTGTIGRGAPAGFGQSATGNIGRSNLGQPGIPSGLADEVGPVPIASSAPVDSGTGTSGGGAGGGARGGVGAGASGGGGAGGSSRSLGGRGGTGPGGLPGLPGGSGIGTSGPGAGAGSGPPAEPGLVSRRARPESSLVQPQTGRFVLPRGGSGPAIEGRIDEQPAAAFNQRNPQQREEVATSRGGSSSSERSVELGLDFLVRHQSADGNWSLHGFGAGRSGYANAGAGRMQADTAATGLALLSFLGAGYTHVDGKHRSVITRGIDYLVRNQKSDGDLFTGGSRYVWLYSHGIAAIALCEAYGMTRDPQLREPAQRAIDFIVAAQSPTEGGWRYAPRQGTDTSVSGWQLMALKSGELAGLKVPASCYAGVRRWLDVAQGQTNGSLYAYRPASEQPHQRDPSAAMTAEGLLMRLYLNGDRSDPAIVEGAEYLRVRLPQFGSTSRPQRDTYYWYYATQTLFQVQGEPWQAWNEQLRNLLVGSQVQTGALAGSWDPLTPVPDRWGPDGGRIYVTAMHLLNLEVYYRHLPLYRSVDGVASRP